MCFKSIFMTSLLLIFVTTFTYVTPMSEVLVELQAPRYVVHHHSATLHCEHNVNPEHLYKVVIFKHGPNGRRIMMFVRGRDPPFVFYNFTGAEINKKSATPTSVTLHNMEFSASGSYACEIALETPLYSKISKIHEITVMVRQKHRPRIKIKNTRFLPGDMLEAACQSGPAHPAPHLTWFINNVKVDERYTTPHGTAKVHRHNHGVPLFITNSSLIVPLSELQLMQNQTLEIGCVSTIPGFVNTLTTGFADIQNYTISVNVVRLEPTPTQLPVKIVSLENNATQTTLTKITIIITLFIFYCLCV